MHFLTDNFFKAYKERYGMRAVYVPAIPEEMMAGPVDEEGWFAWKPVPGTLTAKDYYSLESTYNIKLPASFIEWHRRYFFADADTSIMRLPLSLPTQPLRDIKKNLDWFIPKQLIPQKIYPFGSDANDSGPLVFDGRVPMTNNEFPVRSYDFEYGGDLDGLSGIIFSTFSKLLECATHCLNELTNRKEYEIIPDFFTIDPNGAGKTGMDYWLARAALLKATDEYFEN